MKQIILDLLNQYHKPGLFTTVMKTEQTKKGDVIRTKFIERSAKLWNVRNDLQQYDDNIAASLLKQDKERVSLELFNITKDILMSLKKYEASTIKDPRRHFKTTERMMSWSIQRLIENDIISPYEYVLEEQTQDEEGDDIGMTRLPGEKSE